MRAKDLLSVSDLATDEVLGLIKRAREIKQRPPQRPLAGKVLALLFEKPSLRTRVSFDVAMYQLGGHSLYLSQSEIGLGKREPVADVARVLSRYVNGLAVRTFSQALVQELASHASVPVINALTDEEHPCQALADLLTIYERKGRLQGLTLAFVGDGNNVAHSLLLAASQVGMNFHLATPPGYEPRASIIEKARALADRSGTQIRLGHDPAEAIAGADIVYTDVWTSMGQEAEAEVRRKAFAGYQVTSRLMSLTAHGALLMHPLPSHHGEEVEPGLLDGSASVVLDQAENRLHLQKALLVELLGGKVV